MKRNIILMIAVLLLVIMQQSVPSQAAQEPVQWDYMMLVGSLQHPEGVFAKQYIQEVEKRTGGKIKITLRPGGELPYKSDSYIRVTGENKVAISGALVSAVTGDLKAGALTGLPFLFTDMAQLNKVMNILTPYLNDELSAYGAELLYYFPWPPQVLWGKGKAITNISEIQGKKFRSQGVEQAHFLRGQKAIPASVGSPEVSTALQRGVVDGVITAAANLMSSKWYETLNWGYMLNIQTIPSYVVVNKKALNSLPPDIKKTMQEVAAEFNQKLPGDWAKLDEEARVELTQKYKITIKEPSPDEVKRLTEKSSTYWNEWAKEKGGKAPEALNKLKSGLGL